MNALTSRQRQIVDFIQQWQQLRGDTPTRREIARHFAFASPNAVHSHLRLLIKKGALWSEKGRSRSLRILPLNQVASSPRPAPPFGMEARGAEGRERRDFTVQGFKARTAARGNPSPLQAMSGPLGHIPLFGSIPAGFAEAREGAAEGCVTVDVATIGYQPTRNSFALRVSGESMIGRHILDGDVVILEHGPEPRPGEVVAALIDGNCTLKTYVVKGGRPYLRAENPKYPDLIPARELVIQGVMRALIRPVRS